MVLKGGLIPMNKPRLMAMGLSLMMGASSLMPMTAYAAPKVKAPAYEQTAKTLTTQDIDMLRTLFDARAYARMYPEVVAVFGNNTQALFNHFIQYGLAEGRQINSTFNVNAYRSAYGDLNKAFGNNIINYYQHFVLFSAAENRTVTTVAAAQQSGIIVTTFTGDHLAVDDKGAVVSGSKATEIIKTNDAYTNAVDLITGKSGKEAIDAVVTGKVSTPATTEVTTETTTESKPTSSSNSSTSKPAPVETVIDMDAYNKAYSHWLETKPQEKWFSAEYSNAYYDWMDEKPNHNDYIVDDAAYDTAEEAAEAYEKDMELWRDNQPVIEDFMSIESKARYEEVLNDWKDSEPCREDYKVNIYESASAALDSYTNDLAAYNSKVNAWAEYDQYLSDKAAHEAKDNSEFEGFVTTAYVVDGTVYTSLDEANAAAGDEGEVITKYFPSNADKSDPEAGFASKDDAVAAEKAAKAPILVKEPSTSRPTEAEKPDESEYAYYEDGFESEEDANAKYNEDVSNWKTIEPEICDFADRKAFDDYYAALDEYESTSPNPEDPKYSYTSSEFESQTDADTKYMSDMNNWAEKEPEYNGLKESEQESFDEALEDWKSVEPKKEWFEVTNCPPSSEDEATPETPAEDSTESSDSSESTESTESTEP